MNPAERRLFRALVERSLAALGALVTHQLAYLLASILAVGAPAFSEHRHLPAQWVLVAPPAVAAGTLWVVQQLRASGFRTTIPVHRLAAWIAAFFLAQEVAEAVVTGHAATAAVTHPTILLGLLLAPAVAWALTRLLTGAAELVAWFCSPAGPAIVARPVRPALVTVRATSSIGSSPSRPRAPPTVPGNRNIR